MIIYVIKVLKHIRGQKKGYLDVKDNNDLIALLHENYNVTLQWLVAMQHGNKLEDYLIKNGYKKIAVYGMNEIGNCVARELVRSEVVRFLYAIDQGEPKLYIDVKCFRLNDIFDKEKPDIIIVALPFLFEKIHREIENATGCITKSITEIVYEMDC